KHIENETASYREVAEVSEDSSEIKTAYNNLVKALKAHSQQDPNVAYEKALEFYSVINERHVNVAETLPKWKNAFNAALEAHVLDPSVLTTEEEFASQIKILQAYVDESQLLSSKDSQSYKNFLERMVEISSKNDFAKAAVASWGPDASAEASPLAA